MRKLLMLLSAIFLNEYVTEKICRVYQKVHNFDKGLHQNLTNPVAGGGEQMIRDIESFTDLLWAIRDKIKAHNKTVIEQVQPFIPLKTPVFLSQPLNEEKVKSVFKWDDEDLDVLFHVSKHSQTLWDEIKYWFNKTVAGSETYWLNPINSKVDKIVK